MFEKHEKPAGGLSARESRTKAELHERMDSDEAALLATEFVRLLTDTTAPPKGYVLSIAPQQLIVRDMQDIRETIQNGLLEDDLTRVRASLSDLARLLGI